MVDGEGEAEVEEVVGRAMVQGEGKCVNLVFLCFVEGGTDIALMQHSKWLAFEVSDAGSKGHGSER